MKQVALYHSETVLQVLGGGVARACGLNTIQAGCGGCPHMTLR